MKILSARNTSILSALTAGACCLPALIVLGLSMSSVAWAASLARFHWWFLGAGAVLLAVAYAMFFRERRSCSSEGCSMVSPKLTIASLVLGTLVVGAFAANSFAPLVFKGPTAAEGEARTAAEAAGLAFVTVPVEGMTCLSCELGVEKTLKKLPGVMKAKASVTARNVGVTFRPDRVGVGELVEAINANTGFKASPPEKPIPTEQIDKAEPR